MTHTQTPQVTNQRATHHVEIPIKVISKIQRLCQLGKKLLLRLLLGYDHCCDRCTELEMRGYMQIEGQSTQGSDK